GRRGGRRGGAEHPGLLRRVRQQGLGGSCEDRGGDPAAGQGVRGGRSGRIDPVHGRARGGAGGAAGQSSPLGGAVTSPLWGGGAQRRRRGANWNPSDYPSLLKPWGAAFSSAWGSSSP